MNNIENLQEIPDERSHEINLEFIRRIVLIYKEDPRMFDQEYYKEQAKEVIGIINKMPESHHNTLSELDKGAINYANKEMRPKFS